MARWGAKNHRDDPVETLAQKFSRTRTSFRNRLKNVQEPTHSAHKRLFSLFGNKPPSNTSNKIIKRRTIPSSKTENDESDNSPSDNSDEENVIKKKKIKKKNKKSKWRYPDSKWRKRLLLNLPKNNDDGENDSVDSQQTKNRNTNNISSLLSFKFTNNNNDTSNNNESQQNIQPNIQQIMTYSATVAKYNQIFYKTCQNLQSNFPQNIQQQQQQQQQQIFPQNLQQNNHNNNSLKRALDDNDEPLRKRQKIDENEEVPDEFCDPITFEPMKEPTLVIVSGVTYEKSVIEDYIKENGQDPMTRQSVTINQLVPNRALRDTIERWNKKHPGMID